MKAEYDLSKLKARKNPYVSKLKKPVTMRLSEDVVQYSRSWLMRQAWRTKASSICTCATVLPVAAKCKSGCLKLYEQMYYGTQFSCS